MIWISERPICSQKRLQFYVKNDNEWTKDKNNEKLDNTIEKVKRMGRSESRLFGING